MTATILRTRTAQRLEGGGLLADTVAAVNALTSGGRRQTVAAGQPADRGWVLLADLLADDAALDRLVQDMLAGPASSRGNVAGSFLSRDLACVVVQPVSTAISHLRRGWRLDLDALAVRRGDDGWWDGLAVLQPEVLVLPNDPCAADRDAVVVEDPGSLRAQVATDAVVALEQVFAAVRARTKYGARSMWGGVADGIGREAVRTAGPPGVDAAVVEQRFAEGMAFVDAIAERAPMLRRRPALVNGPSVTASPRSIKGTCCLKYLTQPSSNRTGEGHCAICPLTAR